MARQRDDTTSSKSEDARRCVDRNEQQEVEPQQAVVAVQPLVMMYIAAGSRIKRSE
jgi:hypothetical protein